MKYGLEKSITYLVAEHLCLKLALSTGSLRPKTETEPLSKAYRLDNARVLKPTKSHLRHVRTERVQNEAVLAHQRCVATTDIKNETVLNHHPCMGETEAQNGRST
jgi:hypothetical protein